MDVQDPQYKSADGSAVRIWRDTAKNNFLSEKQGRVIHDDVIYVEIITPGSGNSTPIFEVLREYHPDMNMVPAKGIKYEELKTYIDDFVKSETADGSLTGTPLSQWPEVSRSMAASLRSASIFTVDALAELPDTKLPLVGPDGRTWREKARAYIAAAKDSGYATKLAVELDCIRVDMMAKDETIAIMAAQIEKLQRDSAGLSTETKPTIIADII